MNTQPKHTPLARLKHHVTGAIERGEKTAIVEQRALETWMNKPTAGHETHGQSVVYEEKSGKAIAIIYDGGSHGSLIASAPDMFEALQAGLERLKELQEATGYPTAAIQFRFQDALNKATGGVK